MTPLDVQSVHDTPEGGGSCMELVAQFWNWLTTSPFRAPKKGHPDLYPLDVAKLAKELRVAEEAKRFGLAGLPAADAQSLTATEAQIVQKVEKARADYIDWAVLRLNTIHEDMARHNIAQDINRAKQADKEFVRKANTLFAEQGSLIRSYGETARKRREELDAFRSKHKLTRDAHEPRSAYFLYSILALLIIVEGVLNAGFFAQGVDTGLLGGFTYAAMMAMANVGIAFFLGKTIVRYTNHNNLALKSMGGIGALTATFLMIAMGLAIAHMRDSLTAEALDPANQALKMLLEHPLHLNDIFSWVLFFISVAFALGALFDGLYSDDLYPGYGKVSRRAKAAIEDYEEELRSLRSELDSLKDSELKALDQVAQETHAAVARYESLKDAKKAAGSRLSTALHDADQSLFALLRMFRAENELHRSDAPRPGYFDTVPNLKPILELDFDTSRDELILNEQRQQVAALVADLQKIRGRIQAAYNEHFDRLQPLDMHFQTGE